MVKKFTIPFASQGDANDIPDALQVDGKVSFTQGFGYDYERPYDDTQSKDIAREDMNGLFKAITSAVGELQTLGASEWSNTISYPKGSIVYYEKDLYISQVDDNQNTPPQNWVSITSIANDSLKKAANLSDLTNKATARNNLGLGNSATLNKTDVLGTSTNLVATQKLVNDTKINLENSKQDKLEFVGSGKVLREGSSGLAGLAEYYSEQTREALLRWVYKSGIYSFQGVGGEFGFPISFIAVNGEKGKPGESQVGLHISTNQRVAHISSILDTGEIALYKLLHTSNTTVDKSGFLRASGSANALTTSDVTQSLGISTTDVMSQKAVTDRLNSIESSHGLGYGQRWVRPDRAAGSTYYNTTGKPILLNVTVGGNQSVSASTPTLYVDGVAVSSFYRLISTTTTSVDIPLSAIVPDGSSYLIDASGLNITLWAELRS